MSKAALLSPDLYGGEAGCKQTARRAGDRTGAASKFLVN